MERIQRNGTKTPWVIKKYDTRKVIYEKYLTVNDSKYQEDFQMRRR